LKNIFLNKKLFSSSCEKQNFPAYTGSTDFPLKESHENNTSIWAASECKS